MNSDNRDDLAKRAEDLLNSPPPRPTIDDLMEANPKRSASHTIRRTTRSSLTSNFLVGCIVGAIVTFVILATVSGVASWFNRYPVFGNGVVSSLIVASGAIIGGLLKSVKSS